MCDDSASDGPLLYFQALIIYCGGGASGCVGTSLGVENTVIGFGMAFVACVFGFGSNLFFGFGAMAGSGMLFAAGG